ncbi:hypothetical protein QA648_36585 (plasmid) [Rhizobium sp. CB3171]|uniref:hypothetical protein n=1 Tax=Rhizobium sp. CB3171 TaxID=3039157 RepID=UPI0024B088D6|nr:hypothetical protein [Rhizobium sp. CB3171]WFU07448.1 hypothetical protein QA648_36585 [Rhizobium sp. CB3171]
MDRSYGSKPSYGAEYTVNSSVECSRVYYYIENTANIAVFENETWISESTFGTKPASQSTFTYHSCDAFEIKGEQACQSRASLQEAASKEQELMTTNSEHLGMAIKNRDDEANSANPHRDYIAQMGAFIQKWSPEIEKDRQVLDNINKCLGDRNCVCDE